MDLAHRLAVAARAGSRDEEAEAALAATPVDALATALPDDRARVAFWLNVYNATVRARLLDAPEAYARRWRFFATPAVTVARRRLSPNAIEHGILRRSAFVAGLGYVRNPFPMGYERRLRVDRVDPRIHFALNCGARSCPPYRVWDAATVDADLEAATAAYLAAETRRAADGTAIVVPRLLRWYAGDLGGRRGILALLRRHGHVRAGESPRLRYGDYDWTLQLALPDGD